MKSLLHYFVFTISIVVLSLPMAYGDLIFRSGFEGTTTDVLSLSPPRATDMTGVDSTLPFANDWVNDLEADGRNFWFNYVDYDYGGQNPDIAGSYIDLDPEDSSNHVFYTWQKDAEKQAGGYDSRVQGELENLNWQEGYYKVRFRLSEDLALANDYSYEDLSLSLIEFWGGEGNNKMLIRVVLHKWGDKNSWNNGTAPLMWRTWITQNGQSGHVSFEYSGVQPVYGEWQTLEFYVKSGDDTNGRLYLRLNETDVIFDETVRTKHPNSTGHITKMNPLKSYGGNLARAIKAEGGQMDVWFDDMEIWDSWPTESTNYFIEAEQYAPDHVTVSAGNAHSYARSTASEGYLLRYNGTGIGDTCLVEMPDIAPGSYHLKAVFMNQTYSGIYRISFNGQNLGEYDLSIGGYNLYDFGTVTAVSGDQQLLFTATGAGNSGAYRVYLDTLELNSLGYTTFTEDLTATDDAYVRGGSSMDTNFGQATTLAVKRDIDQTGSATRVSFLKFDISQFQAVQDAVLYLTPTATGGVVNSQLHSVDSNAWSESTITWNTMPTSSGSLVSWPAVKNQEEAIDVTGLVQAALAAGESSVSFRLSTDANIHATYVSKESTNINQIHLEVTGH